MRKRGRNREIERKEDGEIQGLVEKVKGLRVRRKGRKEMLIKIYRS